MDERNKLMENIKNEAAAKLTKELASNPEAYKELMKKLILQVPSLDSMIIRDCSNWWKQMLLFDAARAMWS